MRFAPLHLLAAVPLLAIAAPALAQDQEFQTVASVPIAQGDYQRAERLLTAEVRKHSTRPELLLNLAAVYVYTGRAAEARALYQRVMAQPEIVMDMPSGREMGSHAIAQAGLRRLEARQETARAD